MDVKWNTSSLKAGLLATLATSWVNLKYRFEELERRIVGTVAPTRACNMCLQGNQGAPLSFRSDLSGQAPAQILTGDYLTVPMTDPTWAATSFLEREHALGPTELLSTVSPFP